jgi:Fe2+ transport system protein FeoA
MLLNLAKIVCEGGKFPDGERAEPGRVLYVEGESGAEEIKRRLEDMGFTVWSNLRVLSQVKDERGNRDPLSLERHPQALQQAIEDFGPDWVIIDPLVAFHTRNEIRATEVRHLVNVLADLARTYAIAITFVQHLNKAWQAPGIYRTRGSIDFVAAARVVLRVSLADGPLEAGRGAWALEVPDAHVLEVVKTNLGPKPPALAFVIEDGRLNWYGKTDYRLPVSPVKESQVQRAVRFLVEHLAPGPKPAKEVQKAARAAGHSLSTLRRAREDLGVVPRKHGDSWWWPLPGQEAQLPSHDQDEHLDRLATGARQDVQDDQDDQCAQDVQADQSIAIGGVPDSDPWEVNGYGNA